MGFQPKTTREEDMAYCLMGLFDVHMPPIYGEGSEKAFLRLQQEILGRNSDQTLFLWNPSHEPYNQGLLATSPGEFCTHYRCFNWLDGFVPARREMPLDKIPDNLNPYHLFIPMKHTPGSRLYIKGKFFDSPGVDVQSNFGSNGLELQLLSYGRHQIQNNKERRERIFVAFDISVQSSESHTSVSLVLEQDTDPNAEFIFDRMGAMRRVICTEKASKPLLASVCRQKGNWF
ncbi:13b64175-ddc1-408e-9543-0f1720ca6dde-CDS [Sclerotinia trifoliorum]|uniref:13b64175-ddc1-408e-9543-0f1720ca6dde-CDS n=1 Tax=Sclerotinia trifoliorum TaxID=28548 RepID=A0A8H2VYQ2_9HELO|nr:13b64175-ddc1-408e-9543-0f1720ca6dde-CDS [Sclerotinia trifoliorum]